MSVFTWSQRERKVFRRGHMEKVSLMECVFVCVIKRESERELELEREREREREREKASANLN